MSELFRTGLSLFRCEQFADPSPSRIYFAENGICSRESLGALYASQFQSKTHRQLLRMDKLVRQIDGDRGVGIGPARGTSKIKKLADLNRILSEVRAADREREKVLSKFSQLRLTISAANTLLKRELGNAHESWVAPRNAVERHSRSNSGLYTIPYWTD